MTKKGSETLKNKRGHADAPPAEVYGVAREHAGDVCFMKIHSTLAGAETYAQWWADHHLDDPVYVARFTPSPDGDEGGSFRYIKPSAAAYESLRPLASSQRLARVAKRPTNGNGNGNGHGHPSLMTEAEVLACVPVNRSTLYRHVRAGKFPPPVHMGRRALWRAVEMDAFVQAGCRWPVAKRLDGALVEWQL